MERGGGIPPLFCQDIKRKKGKKLMNWKFWKTDSKNGQSLNQRSSNLPKPKDLPTRVGIYLVTQLKLDPDWVWTLQGVVRPTTEKHNFLDDCLEMVLFEGCFNKETGWVDIKRTADKAA
jgi:hypothetical protein